MAASATLIAEEAANWFFDRIAVENDGEWVDRTEQNERWEIGAQDAPGVVRGRAGCKPEDKNVIPDIVCREGNHTDVELQAEFGRAVRILI